MPKPHISDWLTPEALLRLTAWARDGLTDEQIYHNMGIGKTTYYRWRVRDAAIRDALKKGKEVADIEVENALIKRALGYDCSETRKRFLPDGGVIEDMVTKHIPGDVTAMIYWLKNRRPDRWRDRQQPVDQDETLEKLDQLLKAQREAAERDI